MFSFFLRNRRGTPTDYIYLVRPVVKKVDQSLLVGLVRPEYDLVVCSSPRVRICVRMCTLENDVTSGKGVFARVERRLGTVPVLKLWRCHIWLEQAKSEHKSPFLHEHILFGRYVCFSCKLPHAYLLLSLQTKEYMLVA